MQKKRTRGKGDKIIIIIIIIIIYSLSTVRNL